MIKIVHENKETVLEKIRKGKIDAAALSTTNIVDEIVLAMKKNGILSSLSEVIPDKRKANAIIPLELILTLSAAAKMKIKTAMTDIPQAIQDHRTLGELGYNIIETEGKNGQNTSEEGNKGIMTEGEIRFIFNKYEYQEYFGYYNEAVQNHIMPKMGIKATIHILDCTKLEVEISNDSASSVSDV